MNVYYKIAGIVNSDSNEIFKMIFPKFRILSIGLFIILIVIYIWKIFFGAKTDENIKNRRIIFLFLSFFSLLTSETITKRFNHMLKAREQEIKKIYNDNIVLFDNVKTDNIEKIIEINNKKRNDFEKEVNSFTEVINTKLKEQNLYFEERQILPFIELYVMDKNSIPVMQKVEQYLSPQEVGELCKQLEIKDCFNNSSFENYNKLATKKDNTFKILLFGALMYSVLNSK